MGKILKETVPTTLTQDYATGAVSSLSSAESALIIFQVKNSLSVEDILKLELGI